jgi:hypothetical protein
VWVCSGAGHRRTTRPPGPGSRPALPGQAVGGPEHPERCAHRMSAAGHADRRHMAAASRVTPVCLSAPDCSAPGMGHFETGGDDVLDARRRSYLRSKHSYRQCASADCAGKSGDLRAPVGPCAWVRGSPPTSGLRAQADRMARALGHRGSAALRAPSATEPFLYELRPHGRLGDRGRSRRPRVVAGPGSEVWPVGA